MEYKKTGDLIAQARHEKGMTQKQLAERMHITDRAVSKWERGMSFPDVSLLAPLSEALDLTITELLDGERTEQTIDECTVQEVSQLAVVALQKKTRRIRWLGAALGFVILLLVSMGVYRTCNRPTHPAHTNTMRKVNLTAEEKSVLRLSNSATAKYRYTLTEDVKAARAVYEIWTSAGLTDEGEFWQRSTDELPLSYRGELLISCKPGPSFGKDEPPQARFSWSLPSVSIIGMPVELPFQASSGITLFAARDSHPTAKENAAALLALEYKNDNSSITGELDELEAYVNTAQRGDTPPVAEGGYTLVVWLEIDTISP